MKPFKLVALACAFVFAFAAARAQDVPKPNLNGIVRSAAGTAVEGVEVRIDGSKLSTRTDRSGVFSFVNAPKGTQVLLFRLLGYLPTTAVVHVPSGNDTTLVAMLPTPRNLDTVKVIASVNVLAGVVVDYRGIPIPGATVDMMNGSTTTATTDSTGSFVFTSVKTGSVLLRARKLGFSPYLSSMRLDDWRGLVIHLEPLDYNFSGAQLENLSGFGSAGSYVWKETQQRMSMRGLHAVVIPREELAPYDEYPLGQAIRRTPTGARVGADMMSAAGNVCVLVNGRNAIGPSSLDLYKTDEVEFVEMYPPGTEFSGTAGRYLRASGCKRVTVSGMSGIFYVFVLIMSS